MTTDTEFLGCIWCYWSSSPCDSKTKDTKIYVWFFETRYGCPGCFMRYSCFMFLVIAFYSLYALFLLLSCFIRL